MFCQKCGNQLADSDTFCPACGERVEAPVQRVPVQGAPVQRAYAPPQNTYYAPQNNSQPYYEGAAPQQPRKVRTIADKVIMIVLMITTALNGAIPLFQWINIPVLEDFTIFIGNTGYAGGKNVFTFIQFLDDLIKGYSLTLAQSGMYFSEIELIGILVVAFRTLAIIMVIAMVLAVVMIILALCFQYKPACIFSMISAVVMFIASLCYVILMGILSIGSGLAQMSAWPVISIVLSFVNVIITVVAIILTTKARNKRNAAKLAR